MRELQHTIERAAILCPNDRIRLKDLGFEEGDSNLPISSFRLELSRGDTLQSVIRAYAEVVLRDNGGNLSATARVLGISRNRLTRILEG